jgi:hypothetical protein
MLVLLLALDLALAAAGWLGVQLAGCLGACLGVLLGLDSRWCRLWLEGYVSFLVFLLCGLVGSWLLV